MLLWRKNREIGLEIPLGCRVDKSSLLHTKQQQKIQIKLQGRSCFMFFFCMRHTHTKMMAEEREKFYLPLLKLLKVHFYFVTPSERGAIGE